MMITYIKENLKHVLKQKKKDPQRKFRDEKLTQTEELHGI